MFEPAAPAQGAAARRLQDGLQIDHASNLTAAAVGDGDAAIDTGEEDPVFTHMPVMGKPRLYSDAFLALFCKVNRVLLLVTGYPDRVLQAKHEVRMREMRLG